MFHNFIVHRCDYSPGQIIGGGQYCVEQILGESAVWKVFRVRQTNGTVGALKILKLWEVTTAQRQDWINRFNMEYDLRQTSCRFLAQIMDRGNERGNPFVIVEYGELGHLGEYLAAHSLPNVRLIVSSVLNGLQELHRDGKAHRNLRPANIMIRRDGSAFLANFDFDAGLSDDRDLRRREAAAYLAPEIIGLKRG